MASKPETFCSENFNFEDFISCSETFQNGSIENTPVLAETYEFIRQLANDILEPCLSEFGSLKLTYGFCGKNLSRAIKKVNGGIYPPLDQHAGMELNTSGGLICPRGGMAADFHCLPVISLQVAKFVVKTLPFDRLYFYGNSRPIHVSVNAEPSTQIVIMKKMNTRVVPQSMTVDAFLSL
jgi:hypothetical protein